MTTSKLTISIVVSDAIEAMEFYEKVFSATRGEVYQFPERKGENEANITLGGVNLRLIDENDAYDCHPLKKDETASVWLQAEVSNVDIALEKAVLHGAVVTQQPSEFMGTRHAEITDPFGYTWTINQTLQEMTFEERFQFYKDLQESQDD